MNEITCFNQKYSKKTRKLSKNDNFVTNKTKICLFCYSFIFSMKLGLNFHFDGFYFSCYSFRKSPE